LRLNQLPDYAAVLQTRTMISSQRGDLVKSKFGHANLSCLANYLQLLVGHVRVQRRCAAAKLTQMMPLSEQYAVQYMGAL